MGEREIRNLWHMCVKRRAMHVGFRWENLISKYCTILCAEMEVIAISKSAAAFPRLCEGRGLSHAKPFTVMIKSSTS